MSETFAEEPNLSGARVLQSVRQRQKRDESFPGLDDPAGRVLAKVKHQRGGMTDQEFDEVFAGEAIAPPLVSKGGPIVPGAKGVRALPNTMFETRATMSLLGDTFEEQEATFKGLFPGGELLEVPVTGTVLFKQRPDEPFRKLDPSFGEAIGAGGFGGFVNEMAGDIADLSGDAPAIVGEAVALAFLRRPGGGQLTSDLLRLGVGGAAGEAARQSLQTGQETQRQDPAEQRSLIAGSGTLSIVGGTVGAGLGALASGIARRGIVDTTPEGRAAVKASQEIGTEPLMTSQVSSNPFLRLLSRQSQALVPKIGQYLARQEAKTAQALKDAVNRSDLTKFIGDTAREFNQASNDLLQLTIDATGARRRSPRAGGRFLQQGVERWWKVSGNDVDSLYTAARRIDEPVFDGGPLIAEANAIRSGVQARRRPDPDADLDAPPDAIRVDDEVSPAVDRLLNDISQLDPDIAGLNASGTDVLRTLRRRINEFTVSGPEGGRLSHSIATRLKTAIDDTLENPANLNASPGFNKAWKTANAAARKRFQTREQLAVVDLMKSEMPAQVVDKLARPGQLDNLVAVRKAVPKEEWAKFQESVATELMLDTSKLSRRMAEFDEPTLNLLMNKPRQQIMKEAGREFDKLDATRIQRGLEIQANIRGFFKEVLDTGETARIESFRALVERQGGKNGPLGRSTRAAIVNEVWERSKVVEQSITKVDANKIQDVLSDFEERGVLQFLDKQELDLLRNVELVQDFARLGAKDAGTALQAASAVSDVRGGGVKGLTTLVENWTMGRLLTMPRVNRILLGSGKDRPLDTAAIKLVFAAGLKIAADVEQEAEIGEDVLGLIGSGASAAQQTFLGAP